MKKAEKHSSNLNLIQSIRLICSSTYIPFMILETQKKTYPNGMKV